MVKFCVHCQNIIPSFAYFFFIPNSCCSYILKVKVKSLSRAQLFATPWIVACTKLLCPWDFQGKIIGVGCHFLLQGIFPTQGSNPGLSHCRQTLYHLSHQRSPFLSLLAIVWNSFLMTNRRGKSGSNDRFYFLGL